MNVLVSVLAGVSLSTMRECRIYFDQLDVEQLADGPRGGLWVENEQA